MTSHGASKDALFRQAFGDVARAGLLPSIRLRFNKPNQDEPRAAENGAGDEDRCPAERLGERADAEGGGDRADLPRVGKSAAAAPARCGSSDCRKLIPR